MAIHKLAPTLIAVNKAVAIVQMDFSLKAIFWFKQHQMDLIKLYFSSSINPAPLPFCLHPFK